MQKMSKEGFSPEEVSMMHLGSTDASFIWFPSKEGSVEAKRTWVDAIKKMSCDQVTITHGYLMDHLWEKQGRQGYCETDAAYWNQVSKGIEKLDSYQDLIKGCLADIKESSK